MNKHLEILRMKLLEVMRINNWNITDLSIFCDLSYHATRNIVNGVTKDINLSTMDKICNKIGIPYSEIFETNNLEIFEQTLKRCYFSIGNNQYKISIKNYKK